MKSLLILSLLLFNSTLYGGVCDSASGVNLAETGSYKNLFPRDQGAVGTCYIHSASDLISSYVGTSERINVYEAAMSNNTEASGGDPAEILETLKTRGWACKDDGRFANFFPSTNTNIIAELQDVIVSSGMPVFYSNIFTTPAGEARQIQITNLAAKIATEEIKVCGIEDKLDKNLADFKRISEVLENVENKLKKLEDEKDIFDGWFGTRDTKQINADISKFDKSRNELSKKAKQAHSEYLKYSDKISNGVKQLDSYGIQEAAEIVAYWAKETYPKIVEVFQKYGVAKHAPSLKQYIVEKVQKDPKHIYQYAGAMYPYRLIQRLMANACTADQRINIPKNLSIGKLNSPKAKASDMQTKIESILSKSKPQGVGINLHSSTLSSSTPGGAHAVNIIGCRKIDGVKEYLVHNSWGGGCNSYHAKFRKGKCQNGRVWISDSDLTSSIKGIQWIE